MTWFRAAPHPPFYAQVEHDRPRRTLEISSRSSDRLGRDLSAMNLPAAGDPHGRPVEAVYQAVKCYGDGGPDTQLLQSGYEAPRPRAAPARAAGRIPARRQTMAARNRVRLLRLAVDP